MHLQIHPINSCIRLHLARIMFLLVLSISLGRQTTRKCSIVSLSVPHLLLNLMPQVFLSLSSFLHLARAISTICFFLDKISIPGSLLSILVCSIQRGWGIYISYIEF